MNALVASYLRTLMWTSTTEDGDPLDEDRALSDLPTSVVWSAEVKVSRFLALAGCAVDGIDDETLGHDLALTSGRHGAGFWDGDFDHLGDWCVLVLCAAAREVGELELYVGDDGLVYTIGGNL